MSLADVTRWFSRASRYFHPADLLLPTLPGAITAALYYLGTRVVGAKRPPGSVNAYDPAFTELMMDATRAIGRHYFRAEVRGAGHLPTHGGALLVGNHNGLILPFDSLLTLNAVWDQFGGARRAYALTHDIVYSIPRVRRLANAMGVLRAGHDGGAEALRAGHLVLVYPGSDLDACRPFSARNQIELGGRKGFLKLAARERVPIVPVVSAGTHEQVIVLTRGDGLARALNTNKWLRAKVFPIVLSLPWGVTSGYFPYIPLPAQTTLAFGEPIDLQGLREDDEDGVARAYTHVESRMQSLLDTLTVERTPWIGQPARRRVARVANTRHGHSGIGGTDPRDELA